jgi:hypothetical protein
MRDRLGGFVRCFCRALESTFATRCNPAINSFAINSPSFGRFASITSQTVRLEGDFIESATEPKPVRLIG